MPIKETRRRPRVVREVSKTGALSRLIGQAIRATSDLQTPEELIEAAEEVCARVRRAIREEDTGTIVTGALGLTGLAGRFLVAAMSLDGAEVIEDVEREVIGLCVPGVDHVICMSPAEDDQ